MSREIDRKVDFIPAEVREKHSRYKGNILPYDPEKHNDYATLPMLWHGYSGVLWIRDMKMVVVLESETPRPTMEHAAIKIITMRQTTVYAAMYAYMLENNVEAARGTYDAQLLYFPRVAIMTFLIDYLNGLRK